MRPDIHLRGIVRRIILYPTEPGTREMGFAAVYLHKEMERKWCSVCGDAFWTVGESKICRKLDCYIEGRR